jgi:16S rRNA (guanine966-N2)-methyltransferase
VLDLFAGSGALGIEALSRGARSAVFVERSRGAASVLRRNLDTLELGSRSRVEVRDARRALAALARTGAPFGWIFADPPYQKGEGERLAKLPELLDLLAPDGGLILERSIRETAAIPAAGLELAGTKSYGETAFDWYVRECVEEAVRGEGEESA